MDQQIPDLLRFAQIIGRYRNLIGYMALVGLIAGIVFAALNPPGYTAKALVAFNGPSCPAGAICGGPAFSADGKAALAAALPPGIQAAPVTPNVLALSATAGTAAQAESAVDAAVGSYIAYVGSLTYMGQADSAELVLRPATASAGTAPPQRLLGGALIGAVFAALLGVIAALAGARTTIDPQAAPRGVRAGGGAFDPGRPERYGYHGVPLAQLAKEQARQQADGGSPPPTPEADPPP